MLVGKRARGVSARRSTTVSSVAETCTYVSHKILGQLLHRVVQDVPQVFGNGMDRFVFIEVIEPNTRGHGFGCMICSGTLAYRYG
jgi:uncharacterized protein (DUF1810 family)